MKRITVLAAVACIAAFAITSCKKDMKSAQDGVSQETLAKISQLGFSTANVQKTEGGYLVEGDIVLSDANLNESPNSPTLRIARVEQYRTYNLVNAPRTITVNAGNGISASLSSAIDAAIARYNAQNLKLTFSRVTSGGDINIKIVNGGSFIASSGFPNGGNPYPQVKFNRAYQGWDANTLATIFSHEMGHCIGFRHTDYMDRSFSCGGNPVNEGSGSIGAVWIPGTPTGPDDGSWMLACIGNGDNRPFNSNDAIALGYLY